MKEANILTNVITIPMLLEKLKFNIGKYKKMRCPFHKEKTPSFSIYDNDKKWKCFGCNLGGDIITFTMKYKHLDFNDAIYFLKQLFGMNKISNLVELNNSLNVIKQTKHKNFNADLSKLKRFKVENPIYFSLVSYLRIIGKLKTYSRELDYMLDIIMNEPMKTIQDLIKLQKFLYNMSK